MTGATQVSRIDFGVGQGGDCAKPAPVAYQVTIKVDLTATKAPYAGMAAVDLQLGRPDRG